MPAKRMSDEVCDALAAAIDKVAIGEDVLFDVDMVMTQQGNAQAFINFWVKGMLLGTHVNFTLLIPPHVLLDPSAAEKVVSDALTQAFEMRTQQSAQIAAGGNGHAIAPGPVSEVPKPPGL